MRTLLKLLLLSLVIAGALLWDATRMLAAPMPMGGEVRFEVPPGTSFTGVTERLAQQRLLPATRAAFYVRVYARVKNLDAQIKSGEYRLPAGTSLTGLVGLLVSGRTVLYEVRLIEGWTFAQALDVIRQHPHVAQTLAPDADGAAAMAALGLSNLHPEGRLFPDTYRFERGTPDLTILRRAIEMQQRVLEQEWANRAQGLPYATPEQALVMASIVEKETGLESERRQIAGVFVRRLRLGMRLQTDPTVIYGLGQTFDGNIRLRDLRADTPYNTYTRDGLPPTPICLPGRASIHAALHPEDGDTLFFVSRGDGSHVFSATLDEHNAAVRRYQLGKP